MTATQTAAQPNTQTMHLSYARSTKATREAAQTTLALATAAQSGKDVGLSGRVTDVALFRDALATLIEIQESDLRYRGKDRAAYLAYLMKQGKKASGAIWEAQRAFLEASFRGESTLRGLDPVLTVDPDQWSLEVLSKDESATARLSFDNAGLQSRTAAHGSTFVELDKNAIGAVSGIPAYLPLTLDATPRASSTTAPRTSQYDVPHSWLRGFLQVQSAATLTAQTQTSSSTAVCELLPIDLYNLLLQLRLRKAKASPRALRFELVPGERPRVVIEPWELVIEGHGAVFQGAVPRVVRLFGRTRLALLHRLLPHMQHARFYLLGAGLPSFCAVSMPGASLTVALSSWTESSFAGAAAFDALVPSSDIDATVARVQAALSQSGPQSLPALMTSLKLSSTDARAAAQRLCLRGQAVFDVACQLLRPRTLFKEPVAHDTVAYGNARERHAHTLLSQKGAVAVTKVHDRGHDGMEIHGTVKDVAADRSYAPRFAFDVEGKVKDAWCTCPHYRRSGLREGPCEHMLALRVAYGRQRAKDEAMRDTPEGRAVVRAETRTLLRRDATGRQTVVRVSLDDTIVRVEFGQALLPPRHQRIWFDTDREARDAYFQRLDALMAQGFLDADRALG